MIAGQVAEDVAVAGNEPVLGDDADWIAKLGQDFETTPRKLNPPLGSGTSTMAPCDVNDTTSPWIVLPTGKAATKLMKVKGSFTAGSGVARCFWRPRSWPDGAPPLA